MQSLSSQVDKSTSSLPSVRAGSRKNRVYVFREFLHRTYGDYLKAPGAVILDVAGGKGDLSWVLCNVDRLNSVVIDPRVTQSKHILRSIQYLREHPEEAKERAIPGLLTYQPLAAIIPGLEGRGENFEPPQHLRLLVNDDLVTAVQEYQNHKCTSRWVGFWTKATQRALETHTLGYKEDPGPCSGRIIEDSFMALQTILSAKLVVGFHPDQATDPAIELALALQIPYCIVPCCVYPREFPHRRTLEGDRVRDYSGLVQYLKAKYNPNEDILPFFFTETAKNLVLYSLPKEMRPVS